jgi:cytochrome P450 PksS
MPQLAVPNLASPRFQADPYPFYARLRAEAPVLPVALPDQRQARLVTRYDDVATLLKDDRFAKDPCNAVVPGQRPNRPWVPPGFAPLTRNMLDLDDPDHARLRLLVHQAFTPRVVDGLRDRIQALADELLEAPPRAGRLELVADYALPLPATVIAELLGVPAADRGCFHRWSRRMVAVTSSRDALRAAPAIWAYMLYLRRLFAQRRIQPRDDLLSALVQAGEGVTASTAMSSSRWACCC